KAGEKAVGMVARLEEVKDHETFLLAAQNVLEHRKDVRFYIVGDGSLRDELERRVYELGISSNVTFTGFVKDVEKIEAALDIAVITSKAEALCLSIIESNMAGVPAIGTDAGGVREVIRHGETGYLVSVGDSDRLAERLEELLADDEKRKTFGERAKKYAEKMFMADQMTKRIEKLYLEEVK
ncbi:MAG: glycosyltransferase family 4 protein, partial [Anaerotignum sp.]|nr:glycosyltransferase family 4 protein [Anaerotignum sp.]